MVCLRAEIRPPRHILQTFFNPPIHNPNPPILHHSIFIPSVSIVVHPWLRSLLFVISWLRYLKKSMWEKVGNAGKWCEKAGKPHPDPGKNCRSVPPFPTFRHSCPTCLAACSLASGYWVLYS